MKHYIISQHSSIDYEDTDSTPVAIRHCDEESVIAEVAVLNANVTTKHRDLVEHYYTYNEVPLVGFGSGLTCHPKKRNTTLSLCVTL